MSEQRSSLGHMPSGAWEFDKGVTDVFDDMISRSIPQYPVMRAAVADVAKRFLPSWRERSGDSTPLGVVVDLGCSTGISMSALAPHARKVVGVEVSGPMLEVARQRFAPYRNVDVREMDLRRDYPYERDVDVVLAVLTLQFIPVEHRARVVERAFDSLRQGGALIVVEKVIGETAQTQAILVDAYHEHKAVSGYSRAEIDAKALALEGRLVSNTAEGNVAMLRAAGFRTVECFWRWMSFGAWLAVK